MLTLNTPFQVNVLCCKFIVHQINSAHCFVTLLSTNIEQIIV